MWFKRTRFQWGPQDLYMEHGYSQCLATMIYSFSGKQWPINMIYAITEWGILHIQKEVLQNLVHIFYRFNNFLLAEKYFNFLLFSGENSSFLSFKIYK